MDEGYILREKDGGISLGNHGYDNDLESVRCIFIGILKYNLFLNILNIKFELIIYFI